MKIRPFALFLVNLIFYFGGLKTFVKDILGKLFNYLVFESDLVKFLFFFGYLPYNYITDAFEIDDFII